MAARAVFQLVGAPASPTIGNILIPAGWLPFVGAYSYAVRRLTMRCVTCWQFWINVQLSSGNLIIFAKSDGWNVNMNPYVTIQGQTCVAMWSKATVEDVCFSGRVVIYSGCAVNTGFSISTPSLPVGTWTHVAFSHGGFPEVLMHWWLFAVECINLCVCVCLCLCVLVFVCGCACRCRCS